MIFLSSAPVSINDIDPLQLPEFPISLDMYILKDQTLVLTTTWIADITVTLDFENCKTQIYERFSQTLTLSQKPFNQALVIVNKLSSI